MKKSKEIGTTSAGTKSERRAYQMRTMPITLLDRLRILAAYERTTIEAQVIAALEIGLPQLEIESRERRKQRRVGT